MAGRPLLRPLVLVAILCFLASGAQAACTPGEHRFTKLW